MMEHGYNYPYHDYGVSAARTGDNYTYDDNPNRALRGGNMTERTENNETYHQLFDAENRLISVTVGEGEEAQTTEFIYDGAGNLVKKINPDDSYVLYIGSVMEILKDGTTTQTTIYYPAGGAVRVIVDAEGEANDTNTLSYVLGDQLGSASLTLSSAGAVVGEMRYYPFGEIRVSTGSMPTDHLFTGQRAMLDLGIYHYNARFYSPYLNRWIQSDTLTPGLSNSQSFNRLA
jgi:RHS repeat-associated protein